MENCRENLGAAGVFLLVAVAACGQPAHDATATRSNSDVQQAVPISVPTTTPPAADPPAAAPRLISPLSSSISTSMSPILTWVDGGDPTVDICRDRACQDVLVSFAAAGSPAQPPAPLPPGVVFWRVTSAGQTSSVWQLTIPAHESGRSASWGSVPDFNGDGFADLAVGVLPAGPISSPPANELRIFYGGPRGLGSAVAVPHASPGTTLAPGQSFSGPFGFAEEAGSAGDLDGDGFADLVVWTAGPPPTVTVFRGGPQGLSSPVTFPGPDAPGGNQMRVLSAGDVNGDGYGDLLVGGSVAELFLGGPNGVSTTPAEVLPPAAGQPDARWPIGDGDFNGDGHPDADIATVGNGLLYDGDGQTLIAHPEVPMPTNFGALAGDVNGDGFADLADYAIMTGGPGGPTTTYQAIAGQYFYQGVGDVNGDGFDDVLCMVSSVVGVLEAERLYFGAAAACTLGNSCTDFVPLFVPGHLNDGNPIEVTGAKGIGDVNGDGFADFVYFAPGAGAVYLFLGSPAGPPTAPSQTITAEQGFGFSVAGI